MLSEIKLNIYEVGDKAQDYSRILDKLTLVSAKTLLMSS